MINKRVPLEKFNLKTSFAPMIDMGFFIDGNIFPFNSFDQKFNIINAWWMADFSRLAYVRDKNIVRKVLKNSGFTKIKFINNKKTGTQIIIAHNTQIMIVAFRGTEVIKDFKDVLIDADFFLVNSKIGGKVHKGFKKALDSIWDELKEYIEKNLKNKTLWYTGHSLGAALATLATSRFPATGTYTFGSPRVGNRKFLKTIKSPIYRIAKNRDIVTRVPPPFGYHHTKDLYFINSKNKLIKNPNSFYRFKERIGGNELKIILLLFTMFFLKSPWDFLLSYLHDHSPYNYSVYMWNNID